MVLSRGARVCFLIGLVTAGVVGGVTRSPFLLGVTTGALAMVTAALIHDCIRLIRRRHRQPPPDLHQLAIDTLRAKRTAHGDALADEIERGRKRRGG